MSRNDVKNEKRLTNVLFYVRKSYVTIHMQIRAIYFNFIVILS